MSPLCVEGVQLWRLPAGAARIREQPRVAGQREALLSPLQDLLSSLFEAFSGSGLPGLLHFRQRHHPGPGNKLLQHQGYREI